MTAPRPAVASRVRRAVVPLLLAPAVALAQRPAPSGARALASAVPAAPAAAPATPGPWAGPCDDGGRPATRAVVATSAVAGNVALLVYFKQAWWSGERADRFTFRTDWDGDFRDQDKFGHAYGGYQLTRAGVELLRLACVSPRKAVLVSAAYATLFQLQIEVWDGFFETYGFSYPDVVMNAAGAAFAVAHEVAPRTRAVTPTVWYRPTEAWRRRAEHGGQPRATTDYSGQTYWLSVAVDTILPASARRYWPGFVRVSLGHGITDYLDAGTGAPTRAQRRILLSLDFDPNALPGKHPAWTFVKRQLAHVHFPGPTLQITPSVKANAWFP